MFNLSDQVTNDKNIPGANDDMTFLIE